MLLTMFFVSSLLLFFETTRSYASFYGGSMDGLNGYKVLKVAGQVFNGNKSHADHFSVVHIEKTFMLVGARNFIFNVSLHNLNEHRRISWPSNDVDTDLCLRRQKTHDDCQNYIRFMARIGDNEYYACGTNSYKPMCRLYKVIPPKKHLVLVDEESGTAKVPFDRRHNSTAVYHNGRLYSATVADVSGRDALIFSKPLRTEHHDSQWLNDPSFVSSFIHGDRIYFFFRETAVENINCGKVVFSRVARVCANDPGGLRVLRNTWTSYSKVRINCSLPGNYPFYFDEIQSSSELGSGSLRSTLMTSEQTPMIYALFSTPSNSIRGSAVCAYRMSDIVNSFEGSYKEQRSPFHTWLPLRDAPVPHPGTFCPNSSHALPDQTLNFIKSHPLMDRAVPAYGGQPTFIHTGFDFTLTSIAVDWQLEAANHRFYDVIFIGTDNGKVIKIFNKGRGLAPQTVVSEVLQVFQDNSPVRQLKIFNSPARRHKERKLLVVSEGEIKSIFLHRCSAATACSACVDLKDPYCAWKDHKCSHSSHGLQNLETGHHPGCESPSQDPRTSIVATPATVTYERSVATFHDEAYYPQFQARMEPVENNYEENLSFQLLHRIPLPLPNSESTECPSVMISHGPTGSLVGFLSAILLTFILSFPFGVLFGRFCRANPKFLSHWCDPTNPVSQQPDSSTIEKAMFTNHDPGLMRAAPNSYEVKSSGRVHSVLAPPFHDGYANGYPREEGAAVASTAPRTTYLHYNL